LLVQSRDVINFQTSRLPLDLKETGETTSQWLSSTFTLSTRINFQPTVHTVSSRGIDGRIHGGGDRRLMVHVVNGLMLDLMDRPTLDWIRTALVSIIRYVRNSRSDLGSQFTL